VWSLPLDARLKKQTDSAIADLCNTPTNNAAISASAAWLLHHFCPPTIPWAHLDISGTALWRMDGAWHREGRFHFWLSTCWGMSSFRRPGKAQPPPGEKLKA
jgi:leucyl aminopeptidase